MTTHGKRVEMIQQDTDDDNASKNNGEKGDVLGVTSSCASELSKSEASHDSDDSSD